MSETPLNTFYPETSKHWRKWLQKNHVSQDSIWLIYYKANSGMPSIGHSEAIDDALCFGWIDSKGQSINEVSWRVFFTKRKPKSVWSKVNKQKVEKLIEQGLMTEAGLVAIDVAKQNGSWTILDEVDALIIPEDLQKQFSKYPKAQAYFEGLSRSDKRNILQWLLFAKRAETREKRIEEIITLARENKKPKQFQ